ncbi:MAG: hypothetical protein JO230_23625, partial [Xanthobacteraceae bacterium]|nr:hypothetical protein [Xanthobacteraceae bacterium]
VGDDAAVALARPFGRNNAAKYIPLENLSICPNCGFSGAAADTWVTEDIEKRKFAVLVETAQQIWG